METKRSATQTEIQPTDPIEHSPTESRRGRRHSEEARAKMSEAKRGENHPMYGKKHSAEARAKMSEAHKGKKLSAETRAKLSEALRGRKFSEEHRAKISEALRGRKLSEEHKAKIGEVGRDRKPSEEARAKMSEAKRGENHPMYGKKHSAEARAKMSEAHKGKKPSAETRAKMSAANKGRKHTAETRAKMRENSHNRDKSIEQVRQAVTLHAGGISMSQASLRLGFEVTWLSRWKRNHPERFREFYSEEIEKSDRKLIRRAVGAYALGASMEEASRHVGMPEKWFRGWQDENIERFEIWLKHINDKETRLVRQIFRLCSDEDMSIKEATSELGLESDWLKNWREDHPVRYGQIKEEERLIFGDRLNSLLIRLERQM